MSDLIFLSYEAICSLIGCLIYFAIHRKGILSGKPSGTFTLYLSVFDVYIVLVLHTTGAGTIWDGLTYPFTLSNHQMNWIPFVSDLIHPLVAPKTVLDWVLLLVNAAIESLLNLVLFIPYGVLLYVLWGVHNEKAIAWNGFSFSLLIELSQLFNIRVTDIDDLVLNTLGTVLGVVLLKRVMERSDFVRKAAALDGSAFQGKQPMVLVTALFAGRFLLYNEIGLAKALHFI